MISAQVLHIDDMPVHIYMPPGAFRPNQAATKSVLSRRLRDTVLGQIKTMLEAMGKEGGGW